MKPSLSAIPPLADQLPGYWRAVRVLRTMAERQGTIGAITRRCYRVTQTIANEPIEKQKYRHFTGMKLDLRKPTRFTEKIVWKKLHDRNPLIPLTADKYLAREYVNEVCEANDLGSILLPLLHVTEDARTLPLDKLPPNYIIKATHASGLNIFVRNGNLDAHAVPAELNRWLRTCYAANRNEWAYQKIKPRILVEPMLIDSAGRMPTDYKLYIFHGRCQFINASLGIGTDHFSRGFFDVRWNPLYVSYNEHKVRPNHQIPPPTNLEYMIKAAELLATPFDFVRVDLYEVDGQVYFGELTHYPNSGYIKYNPRDFDERVGDMWRLRKHYWRQSEQ